MWPGPASMPSSTERRPRPAGPARWLRACASLSVSAGLLLWLTWQVDTRAVWSLIRDASPLWLLAAIALGPVQIALCAARWAGVCAHLEQPLSIGRALREIALSILLNQLLPSGVAGDGLRIWRQRIVGLGAAFRSVVVDRWIGQWLHALLTVLSLWAWSLLGPTTPPAPAWIAVLAVALALSSVPFWPIALGRDAGHLVRHPRVLLSQIGTSFLLILSFVLGFAFCAQALGHRMGVELFLVIPLVLLAMAVPLSLGGWGPREGAAMLLLPSFGWSNEEALALSALYGFTVLLGALPGALVPLIPEPSS